MDNTRRSFLKKMTVAGIGTAGLVLSGQTNAAEVVTETTAKDKKKPVGKDDGKLRFGFIGTGSRCQEHINNVLSIQGNKIVAICDIQQKSIQKTLDHIAKFNVEAPKVYTGSEREFEKMLNNEDFDCVIIASPWEWHTPMAITAMKAGVPYVGVEVSAAISLQECWDLVNTSESTGSQLNIMWMLTMGDADCYNKGEQRTGWKQTTPDVISQIGDKYVEYDMPRGWILPNDGYGCGYVKLDSVVRELGKRGFHTGLWTENGVDKIAYEVGKCGTRLCKLDVAWVGDGYEFALNGCKSAFEGIQNNTNERGFVWSVCGWAGTQRYSTVWSGDQSSNWDYIRYHIPTITGAGLSAMNAATSDVDGIFGGSPKTYTRDLEWKIFTPIFMAMSGWADADRQPWVYGHPYTDINRKYLKLKMRLNPYTYTYCHKAHDRYDKHQSTVPFW